MEDGNSTNNENTKWMIEKVSTLHEVFIKEIEARANKIERKGDKGISELKEWRTIGTSALMGILSIILVLNSTYTLDIIHILIIVISLIIIIVVYFIILTKLVGLVQDVVNDIISVLEEGVERLSFSQGYFLSQVTDITKIDYSFVRNYFLFLMLVDGAYLAYGVKQFRKLAKHYARLRDLKKELESEAKLAEKYLESMPKYLEGLDRNNKIPQELLKFVEEELKKYKPTN